jgi:hypothetical protein
MRQKVDKRR